jgi:hypothetical protein
MPLKSSGPTTHYHYCVHKRLTHRQSDHIIADLITYERRFLWTVQYFVGAGFYVIPTYSPSDFSADNTVASTPAVFLRNWANLWSAISEVRGLCRGSEILMQRAWVKLKS